MSFLNLKLSVAIDIFHRKRDILSENLFTEFFYQLQKKVFIVKYLSKSLCKERKSFCIDLDNT